MKGGVADNWNEVTLATHSSNCWSGTDPNTSQELDQCLCPEKQNDKIFLDQAGVLDFPAILTKQQYGD